VAAATVLAEVAVVRVVALVAIDTGVADVAVLARQVALLTRHGYVQADERVAGEVMIEAHALAPPGRRVALGAIAPELAQMHVVRAVTAQALGRQLLGGDVGRVTGVAGNLLVAADQRPMSIAGMIEVRRLPLLVSMAVAAVLAETPGVRVLRAVAAKTILWHLVLEIPRAMAVVAGDLLVHAFQRETGLLVIELGGLPPLRRVALAALGAPLPVVHVIRLMAGAAFLRRVAIAIAEVAGGALDLGVLVVQRKASLAVVIRHVMPRGGVVAGTAIASELAFVGFLLLVTGKAIGGGLSETLVRRMAAITGHVSVHALERVLGLRVVELLAAELDDVRIAPQMLGMTGMTLGILDPRQMTVESALLPQVGGDIFMAIETQLRLAIAIAAVMALRALFFVLRVRRGELAGHEQCFRIHGFSGRCRQQP